MQPLVPLGAPGLYFEPPASPLRALTGVRMDVCAFAGVAPRGPARVLRTGDDVTDADGRSVAPGLPTLDPARPRSRSVAVAVESFDEYRRLYGGFDGPGRLPYAVASFFEQGGLRAYIVRIVHEYGPGHPPLLDEHGLNELATARGSLPGLEIQGGGAVRLRARNEGAWGDRLRAGVTFTTTPLEEAPTTEGFTTAIDAPVGVGTLVRISAVVEVQTPTGKVDEIRRALRFIVDARTAGKPDAPDHELVLTFETPLDPTDPEEFDPRGADIKPFSVRLEIVEAEVTIDDGDGRVEVHGRVGFSVRHPRGLGSVLRDDSRLVWPAADWEMDWILPVDPRLLPGAPSERQFMGGEDRYPDLTPGDFFDPGWVLGNDEPGQGLHSLVNLSDLALICAPDLYEHEPLPAKEAIIQPVTLAGDTFATCVPLPPVQEQEAPPPGLDGLFLDPATQLEEIIGWQQKLVELCELLRGPIALLDVPPGLLQRRIMSWRARFRSEWAAAYHPWIAVSRPDDPRGDLVRVNPSAVAAGIIARQERLFGVQHGPANALAAEVVLVDDLVPPARHAELHQGNVNVFLREPDGIRLTGARTLSFRRDWRQLNVRRLMTMLERTLDQQCQWMVFEPNDDRLRGETERLLDSLLSALFRANAFAGATEEDSFFIDVHSQNDQRAIDAGQFIVLVGVAPAEPMEFLVIRLVREPDQTLRIEGGP